MSDTSGPEWAKTLPDLGASWVCASFDATRRFCEQGRSVASTVTELSAEVSQFLSNRVSRNSETIGRMTTCQNLPEVFTIQAQWLQDATDDYLKEMRKLMEVNSKIMGDLLAPVGQVETRPPAASHLPTPTESLSPAPSPSEKPPTPAPPAKAPTRGREQTVSEAAKTPPQEPIEAAPRSDTGDGAQAETVQQHSS